MDGAGRYGVTVHPEQAPVLGHVPHEELEVGQGVLRDDPLFSSCPASPGDTAPSQPSPAGPGCRAQ